MSDPDNPALNADGTLKDASELVFLHSPSDEQPNLNRRNQQIEDNNDDDDELPVRIGLKGKEPARIVAKKRVPRVSEKAQALAASKNATAQERRFFSKNFDGEFNIKLYL
jgi:hypothetical protein